MNLGPKRVDSEPLATVAQRERQRALRSGRTASRYSLAIGFVLEAQPMRSVALVVVTYNSAKDLPALLDSVALACKGLDDVRIVIVDNDSADGTVAVARRYAPDATIVEMGYNGGYAAAINAGIKAAGDVDTLLVLNPDLILGPSAVTYLMSAVGSNVGIAVPRLVDESGATQESLRREPTLLRALGEAFLGGHLARMFSRLSEMVADPWVYERPSTADWACGAAMLITRACSDTVGLWNEDFFLYSEEADFALRARDLGFSLVYVPKAMAMHRGGDLLVSPRLWSMLAVNRVRLYAMRHNRFQAGLYSVVVTLNEGLRSVRNARHRAAFAALLLRSRQPHEIRPAGIAERRARSSMMARRGER